MSSHVIISCGARKQAAPAPALELYTGSYFRAMRRFALYLTSGNRFQISVFSAKHGIVPANSVIAPYDVRIGQAGAVSSAELAASLRGIPQMPLVCFCGGRDYLTMLRAAWNGDGLLFHATDLMDDGRRGIGAQIQWFRSFGES